MRELLNSRRNGSDVSLAEDEGRVHVLVADDRHQCAHNRGREGVMACT